MHLPKTTAEQRSQFYTDVEALLYPGFLIHPVTVAGVRFQLRSLSPGDIFMLRARADGAATLEWRRWLVSTSVWMVDGQSVLGQDGAVPLVAKSLEGMPPKTLDLLFSLVLGLFARVQRSIDLVTAYCYEVESRYKWLTFGRGFGQVPFGVPGADRLGLNTVQQIWSAYNQHEDQRLQDETQWSGFKLVASTNAAKAIKKLDESDRQRHQTEQERRGKVLDTLYYTRLGVLSPETQKGLVGSGHRLQSKSVEDLEEEMRRWVTGDADIHDATVEAYKADIRAKREAEKAAMAARQIALQAERERLAVAAADGGVHPQPLLALTGEQLQQMLQGRGMFGRSGTTFIPTAPHADRLYDKYVAEGAVTSGQLQATGDKVFDPLANSDVDARTLNQLIKGRNPTFGSGE